MLFPTNIPQAGTFPALLNMETINKDAVFQELKEYQTYQFYNELQVPNKYKRLLSNVRCEYAIDDLVNHGVSNKDYLISEFKRCCGLAI